MEMHWCHWTLIWHDRPIANTDKPWVSIFPPIILHPFSLWFHKRGVYWSLRPNPSTYMPTHFSGADIQYPSFCQESGNNAHMVALECIPLGDLSRSDGSLPGFSSSSSSWPLFPSFSWSVPPLAEFIHDGPRWLPVSLEINKAKKWEDSLIRIIVLVKYAAYLLSRHLPIPRSWYLFHVHSGLRINCFLRVHPVSFDFPCYAFSLMLPAHYMYNFQVIYGFMPSAREYPPCSCRIINREWYPQPRIDWSLSYELRIASWKISYVLILHIPCHRWTLHSMAHRCHRPLQVHFSGVILWLWGIFL